MDIYYVIRLYENDDIPNEIIQTGLSLEEAQAHCRNPETSSSTATSLEAVIRTRNCGRWFDAYDLAKSPKDFSLFGKS